MYRKAVISITSLLALLVIVVASGSFRGEWAAPAVAREDDGIALAEVPELTPEAKAAVLMDATTGDVLYAKNAHQPFPPASVTKVMTLALIFESLEGGRIQPGDKVIASENAHDLGGSEVWLEPGESMTVSELIKAVAVGSANDASVALAEHIAGSEQEFVAMMNERAAQLGMKDSQFKNVHGLDEEGHVMSAMDVAIASRYALRFPGLLEYTSKWEEYLRGGKSWLVNTNKLLVSYPGCDGLKTGSTDKAGFCVSATAKRDDTRLISVIMNAPDSKTRFSEAARLLDYGFANYRTVRICGSGEVVGRLRVAKGRKATVGVAPHADVGVTVKRNEKPKIEYKIVPAAGRNQAPIVQGQKIAELRVMKDGKEVRRQDLFAADSITRASFLELLLRVLGRWGAIYS